MPAPRSTTGTSTTTPQSTVVVEEPKITTDDIGVAQQVLQRLLSEKRSLEQLEVVLQTVKTAVQDLDTYHKAIDTAKDELDTLRSTIHNTQVSFAKRKEDADVEYAALLTKLKQEHAVAVGQLTQQIGLLNQQRLSAQQTHDTAMAQFNKDETTIKADIVAAQAQLDSIKAQYDAITTSMQQAIRRMTQEPVA